MKKLLCTFPIVVLGFFSLLGQVEERYLRIQGKAQTELVATGAEISLIISEQQPNEYARTTYLPFEAAYTNLLEELFTLGIHENQLIKSQKFTQRFTPVVSKEYTLKVNDIKLLENIFSLKTPGVQFSEVKYTYPKFGPEVESTLARAALADAQTKATSLSKTLNLKTGKILSIEDHSSGCSKVEYANTSTLKTDYTVTVKFELTEL